MFSHYSLTNKGSRPVNEDSVGQYVQSDCGLFIVADGLGGHEAGDIASAYVVEQYLGGCGCISRENAERYFSGVFLSIHRGLQAMQKQMKKDMKSTAAAVMLTRDTLSVCHIGDSRVYVFSRHRLLFRTLDHSVPQMLVNAGELRERDIRFHPDRNRLLRALGEEGDVIDYDTKIMRTDRIAGILLCSDGFWEYIDERRMLHAMLRAGNAREWILDMEQTLLKNSANRALDNYSAIGIML